MRSSKLRLAPIIGFGLLAVMLLPGAAAASSPLAINVPRLNAACMFITAPANQTLTLQWKDAMGALKESTSIPTGSAGEPLYCSPSNVVEVGDQLKVGNGSTTHKLKVPSLTAQIDRETDTMSGHGPASATLRIECGGSPYGQFEPCQYTKNVTANGSGNWSQHIPFDLFGGFTMSVRWHNAYGDIVYRWVTTPYFQVFLGQANVSGVGDPDSQPSVLLENSSSAQKGSVMTQADANGAFSGKLRNNHGNLVTVTPGDHAISDIAGDAGFVVPQISAMANAANDHVHGQCQLNGTYAGVFIQVYRSGQLVGSALGGASDGTFNVDFGHASPTTRTVNIKAGDKLLVKCIQGAGDYAVKVIFA